MGEDATGPRNTMTKRQTQYPFNDPKKILVDIRVIMMLHVSIDFVSALGGVENECVGED